MATDIYKELSEIARGRYGSDIRFPIHDALSTLANDGSIALKQATRGLPLNHPTSDSADISQYLTIIETNASGATVKDAIHDALLKLSGFQKDSIHVITGLAGIDLSNPIRPEAYRPNDYIYNLTSFNGTTYVTDWARLATFMRSTNLFSDVQVSEWESQPAGIDVYANGSKFFSLQYAPVLTPSGEATMYIAMVTRPDSLTGFGYPYDASEEALTECLAPDSAFRTDDKVLITCFDNAILFAKNSNGGVSLSFGAGYDLFPTDQTQATVLVDPSTKILTFTQQYVVSEYGGVDQREIAQLQSAATSLRPDTFLPRMLTVSLTSVLANSMSQTLCSLSRFKAVKSKWE